MGMMSVETKGIETPMCVHAAMALAACKYEIAF